jgi:hypothetical protein
MGQQGRVGQLSAEGVDLMRSTVRRFETSSFSLGGVKTRPKLLFFAIQRNEMSQKQTVIKVQCLNSKMPQSDKLLSTTYASKRYVAKQYVAKCYVAKQYVAKQYVTKCYVTKRYVAKCYFAKRYVAKQNTAKQNVTKQNVAKQNVATAKSRGMKQPTVDRMSPRTLEPPKKCNSLRQPGDDSWTTDKILLYSIASFSFKPK